MGEIDEFSHVFRFPCLLSFARITVSFEVILK